jgi:hypothetical protein
MQGMKHITQSFIKTFREYLAGEECGNIVREEYIDGRLIERDSDSMAEGRYFEYVLTGALPKGNKVPEAMRTGKGELTMEYKRAEQNAKVVKELLFETWGLIIVKKGAPITKGRFEGTIDLIVECTFDMPDMGWKKGDRFVIDIKYSGLLYDKWEKFGWMFSNIQKTYHGTQAKQYHYVTGLPFYFLVVGNKNILKEGTWQPTDIKMFYTPVDAHMIEQHLAEGNDLFDRLAFLGGEGLEARPSYSKCVKCPLNESCTDKHTYPIPVEIDLTLGL